MWNTTRLANTGLPFKQFLWVVFWQGVIHTEL